MQIIYLLENSMYFELYINYLTIIWSCISGHQQTTLNYKIILRWVSRRHVPVIWMIGLIPQHFYLALMSHH